MSQPKRVVHLENVAAYSGPAISGLGVQAKPLWVPRVEYSPETLPLESALRLELREGVPIFCAPDQVQGRIERLVEKEQAQPLTPSETEELQRYEELDDFLSLVNRLVRNLLQGTPPDSADAQTP